MIRLLILLILSTTNPWAAEAVKCKTGGNQMELNETYQALIIKQEKNQVLIAKLRGAQRAWLAYRDAELESAFACEQDKPRVCWSSMYPLNFSTYKAWLTRERTKRLKHLQTESLF